jgi:hypothetical protein
LDSGSLSFALVIPEFLLTNLTAKVTVSYQLAVTLFHPTISVVLFENERLKDMNVRYIPDEFWPYYPHIIEEPPGGVLGSKVGMTIASPLESTNEFRIPCASFRSRLVCGLKAKNRILGFAEK